jgi:glutathione synthase/RimK-type ligase-like ATP-grasp enzyme
MIAIVGSPGSFSDRWVQCCIERGIEHRVIDGRRSDVMDQVAKAKALLWHYGHTDSTDTLIANSILTACEAIGIKVFPDAATRWHFDDKLAQKYLFEAIRAPHVPAHVFFDRDEALRWADEAQFPMVFKLRRGAGSANVQLVRDRPSAHRLIRRAFGRGFSPVAALSADFSTKVFRTRGVFDLAAKLRRLPRTIRRINAANRGMGLERDYVYFQDFIPNNHFDTRVTVIGQRAFAFTRDTRPGDFRASGSGRVVYDRERIDPEAVRRAFSVAAKLKLQSGAFDFIRAPDGAPLIVEVSYGYVPELVHKCSGYYNPDLSWSSGAVWPQDAILDDVITSVRHD